MMMLWSDIYTSALRLRFTAIWVLASTRFRWRCFITAASVFVTGLRYFSYARRFYRISMISEPRAPLWVPPNARVVLPWPGMRVLIRISAWDDSIADINCKRWFRAAASLRPFTPICDAAFSWPGAADTYAREHGLALRLVFSYSRLFARYARRRNARQADY